MLHREPNATLSVDYRVEIHGNSARRAFLISILEVPVETAAIAVVDPLLPQAPYDRHGSNWGLATVHSDRGPQAILTNPAKERRTEALYVMACWTSYCARKIAFGIIP